jgi:cysteinyl-tRNA synthetase
VRFYNTLTQQVEEFVPADGHTVRMYTCGPTVYNYVHIGNLRTFTFQDILRRWLKARGFTLNHVMNITDVEDKIIRAAMEQHKSLQEYTSVYEKAFLDDCAKLRLERPERLVRATEHIPEMVDAVEKLTDKGFTYSSDGSVYYRIAKFQAGRDRHARRSPRRCRRVRQGRCAGFRALESQEEWRAELGCANGRGSSGLAYRVFGDGNEVSR